MDGMVDDGCANLLLYTIFVWLFIHLFYLFIC